MSWFSRCSWCGGPFNSGNCQHCTNVSFRDDPVYDSNPISYKQTLNFSNPPPHHNYRTYLRSDTGAAFQAEFVKFQHNFERFMAQLSCSNCGGLFNGRNCPSCSIVGAENECVNDLNPFSYDNTPNFYDQPPQHHVETYSCELCGNDSHYGYDCPPWFLLYPIDQSPPQEISIQDMEATNLSIYTAEPSLRFNSFCYDDDDDEESTISPFIAITPALPIMDTEDSLIMRDEDLRTIPEKESDEFIKSSVKDLVPNPSDSEDTSDSKCDLPFCDNSMTLTLSSI
nr:hypothetical protein [Tanacetum cinerariifolium]